MQFITILLLFLCTAFPLLHMFNALPIFLNRKKPGQHKVLEYKTMSILIPCYNEESIIETAIKGMERIDYLAKEVIYINDGSQDGTLKKLHNHLRLIPEERKVAKELRYKNIKHFYKSSLYPNVYVIDKENGGKDDALNAGIEYAKNELVVTLDADSILADNALQQLNKVFQDDNVIAAGGMVHALQGVSFNKNKVYHTLLVNHVVRFQIFDFIKGFYINRISLAKLDALSVISGAFGIFNKEILFQVGGYRKTLGEDIDITLKFQQYILKNRGKKMVFVPEAVCYTECPETWRDLFKQRVRWQKAFIDCIVHYFPMLIKTFPFRTVSFFFLIDSFVVGTIAIYISLFNLGNMLITNIDEARNLIIFYLLGAVLFNLIYSMFAVILARYYGVRFKGKEKIRLAVTIVLDLFVFRFVTLFIVLYGTMAYFVNRNDWNKVARTGRIYELEKDKGMVKVG
ncbi:glycosyltransferase family 2 protein [Bacillus sp. RG28]|uniref:Glycosyltransferase family 2 protein n=1 Tax=Gottfriedia endophytica TaxID=2820819 RepID=A0A940NX74_9BACI|nr:glycosyltransferase [Gottfriedia endophytica]MBP0726658.1 glycosyltransferase family 2 protein [Gottfriedia endophytica]